MGYTKRKNNIQEMSRKTRYLDTCTSKVNNKHKVRQSNGLSTIISMIVKHRWNRNNEHKRWIYTPIKNNLPFTYLILEPIGSTWAIDLSISSTYLDVIHESLQAENTGSMRLYTFCLPFALVNRHLFACRICIQNTNIENNTTKMPTFTCTQFLWYKMVKWT